MRNPLGPPTAPYTLRHYLQLRPFTPKSLVLVMLGIIFVLVGATAIVDPWTATQREALVMLVELAPRPFWGWLSIVIGLLGIWSSRWPTMSDSWGFVALGGLSMWWACAYAFGAAVSAVNPPPGVAGSAVTGSFTWLGMCVLLYAISRLQDPLPTREDPS